MSSSLSLVFVMYKMYSVSMTYYLALVHSIFLLCVLCVFLACLACFCIVQRCIAMSFLHAMCFVCFHGINMHSYELPPWCVFNSLS